MSLGEGLDLWFKTCALINPGPASSGAWGGLCLLWDGCTGAGAGTITKERDFNLCICWCQDIWGTSILAGWCSQAGLLPAATATATASTCQSGSSTTAACVPWPRVREDFFKIQSGLSSSETLAFLVTV